LLEKGSECFENLLCGCQALLPMRPLFSFFFMTLADQRETACYSWHGTRPSH
jgi:hypothetical protein